MHIYMYASVCPALQLSTTHDHETTGAGITAFIQTPAPLRPRAVDPGGTTVSLNRERECGDMLGDPLCIVIRLHLSLFFLTVYVSAKFIANTTRSIYTNL